MLEDLLAALDVLDTLSAEELDDLLSQYSLAQIHALIEKCASIAATCVARADELEQPPPLNVR